MEVKLISIIPKKYKKIFKEQLLLVSKALNW
jgi:hypothetical protein